MKREVCVCVCIFWGFTFAVGIWTAIDGVGSSPGAEGCMAGGCIGLKAPCENINETQNKNTVTAQGSDDSAGLQHF